MAKSTRKPTGPPKSAKRTARPAPPASSVSHGRIKVRAIKLGFYDNARRREGDVFMINGPKEFSEKWMEYVDKSLANKITTSKAALAQRQADLRGQGHATEMEGARPGATSQVDEDIIG